MLVTIGEFARRSHLSLKALRLYERQGLLRPASVDPSNGYRRYHEDQLADARLIALLRRLDLPLAEVARVMAADDRAAVLAAYWARVEQRFAVQRDLAAHLHVVLTGGKGLLEMYEVQLRDVPEQVVLTEQRHVLQPELVEWMTAAMSRVEKAAAEAGGVSGAPFAIYHGEVNEDGDGPVEVCVPIAAQPAPSTVPARVEPAHREAYVRLKNREVEYPQILSAYDAVAAWIKEQGLTEAGSPREVYWADCDAAGPDDEVCDIAWPVK
ncbi:DNA-binding transcriptional MerR regulator [Saccharothrix variisporea]|uniref:DNA-binding transcriptional MerR regulator n=2 Tax=Saccharothrix variisporea TaxID=543527 RepID=A0A495XDM6_9PSEU|nr:DNA-binding transcriptional MerR regulator [Saccharothrix variisporea]